MTLKNLTPAELMRLISYTVAVLLGAFMTVWGIIHGDWALITAGIALVTTGSIAGVNVPGVRASGKYAAD